MCDVRIVKSKGLLFKVQEVHVTTSSAQFPGHVLHYSTSDRLPMEAANDGEDIQSFRHNRNVAGEGETSNFKIQTSEKVQASSSEQESANSVANHCRFFGKVGGLGAFWSVFASETRGECVGGKGSAQSLRMNKGYLIDMDGVVYRENQLIAGAADFVQALTATGTPFLFLTNNSAPTPEDLSVRLKHLGIHGLSAKHFYTSALNTADFLSETDPNCTVFVIGEGGILTALHERKIANDGIRPHYVVIGEGATTREKLTKAHECVERGARLRATNPDNCCPVSSEK